VLPTSLNEGRGDVVVPAFVIVFHLGLKRHLVDGVVVQASGQPKCRNAPNAERRKTCHFGKGRETGFPVACSCGRAEDKPASEVRVENVSNVIYQNVYLIRLFFVSGFLSNYIPLIYQIAR